MRRAFLTLAVVATSAGILPVGAYDHHNSVSVFNNYFTPRVFVAGAGDTVEWNTSCAYGSCGSGHNVTAYSGASFASSTLTYPQSFSTTLSTDDPVKYRCTIHSSLSGGTCNGMCGEISKNADVTPPNGAVTQPSKDEIVIVPGLAGDVTIAGTATDNVAVSAVEVRIYPLGGTTTTHPATCTGCPGASATWTRSHTFSPGVYTVEARIWDTSGNLRTSPQVRFFVI